MLLMPFKRLMPSMQYASIMYDTSLAAFLISVGVRLNQSEDAWQEGWWAQPDTMYRLGKRSTGVMA